MIPKATKTFCRWGVHGIPPDGFEGEVAPILAEIEPSGGNEKDRRRIALQITEALCRSIEIPVGPEHGDLLMWFAAFTRHFERSLYETLADRQYAYPDFEEEQDYKRREGCLRLVSEPHRHPLKFHNKLALKTLEMIDARIKGVDFRQGNGKGSGRRTERAIRPSPKRASVSANRPNRILSRK